MLKRLRTSWWHIGYIALLYSSAFSVSSVFAPCKCLSYIVSIYISLFLGVRLTQGGDNLGQQYLTPQEVIKCRQSDVIIVGRGILSAENQVSAAKLYQEAGYTAFEELLQEQ